MNKYYEVWDSLARMSMLAKISEQKIEVFIENDVLKNIIKESSYDNLIDNLRKGGFYVLEYPICWS